MPPADIPAIRWPAPVAADEWQGDDRIRGAFLGLAIGDGLGALRHAGGTLPTNSAPGSLRTGGATQLALFTAEGILRMYVRLAAKGIGPAWGVIRHALDRWMVTQGRSPNTTFNWDPAQWPDGWLVRQHRLHRRIEGFGATIEALRTQADPAEGMAENHVPRSRPNTNNGAGALVRVLSAGLVARPEDAILVGAVASAMTHGGADGYLAGGALARVVADLVSGEPVASAITNTMIDLGSWPSSEHVREATGGGSATGRSSAARALATGMHYASFINPDEPMVTIERAVAVHGTAAGAVAGALVGARFGAIAFPSEWLVAPDLTDVIEEMARACSAAHRAWVLGRRLPGYDPGQESLFDEDPACALFWPRFPGW